MERVAVILAGGGGNRLRPTSYAVNKHLLPVYDKPMILLAVEFARRTLSSKPIVIVTNQPDILPMSKLLNKAMPRDEFVIIEQNARKGVASALKDAANAVEGHPLMVLLGDNYFHGDTYLAAARAACKRKGASAMALRRPDVAKDSCVVEFEGRKAVNLLEKPKRPRSPWVMAGLYCYPADVANVVSKLKPSARGELEITDVNKYYLETGNLTVSRPSTKPDEFWFDLGTPDRLLDAARLRYATQDQ